MKILFSILVILAGMVATHAQQEASTTNMDSVLRARKQMALNKPFPRFTANSADGLVSNDLLENKVVLINFWFEGCHPCMEEMAMLNALHQELKDNKDFLFISFTFDDDEAIQRVKEKHQPTFGILSTSQMECARLNFKSGYPTTIILDKKGVIRYIHNVLYDLKLLDNKKGNYQDLLKTAMISEVDSLL
jgi:thiol-disulfide isomerase/thioredoxin